MIFRLQCFPCNFLNSIISNYNLHIHHIHIHHIIDIKHLTKVFNAYFERLSQLEISSGKSGKISTYQLLIYSENTLQLYQKDATLSKRYRVLIDKWLVSRFIVLY